MGFSCINFSQVPGLVLNNDVDAEGLENVNALKIMF